MLRRTKLIFPALLVVFWLVMMGLLVKREYFLPALPGDTRESTLAPREDWMGVFLPGGQRVGFTNSRVRPETRDGESGVSMTMTARLTMTLLGRPTEIAMNGSAFSGQGGELRTCSFRIRSEGHTMEFNAAVDAGVMAGTLLTGGEEIPVSFPVDERLSLGGGMGLGMFNLPQLVVGQEYAIDSFNPMSLSVEKARLRCDAVETIQIGGESIEALAITLNVGGLETKLWVAEDEELLRAETPLGFSLERIEPEEALAAVGELDTSDILALSSIRPTGLRPFRGARRMVVRAESDAALPPMPSDAMQQLAGDTLTIIQPVERDGASESGATEIEVDALRSDGFVQSNHPRVINRAREIVGGEADPWKAAVLIHDWVYAELEKIPVVSVPSALEVLSRREGDCNEHTVLFAALARAVEIPTRIALGLAWSDTYDGFYYHAWPEVYVGEWVAMDPTFGQRRADATHIKLLTGGIEEWQGIMPYIGRVKLEVLELE